MADTTVYIFYSGDTEPELLDMYSEGIQYLRDADIELEVVDVAEDREAAKEHDVTATPLLLVEREDGEDRRHPGVVGGLKQLLMEDLYGLSVLQKMGFKDGRELVRGMDDVSQEAIEEALHDGLEASGVEKVSVKKYDAEGNTALVELEFGDEMEIEDEDLEHDVQPFLGGAFTEVFGTGVKAVISEADRDNDRYRFKVAPPTEERKKGLADLLKKMTGLS